MRQLEDTIAFGKLPPQSIDIEEAVLGACLLEPKAITVVIQLLQPDMFYREANQTIYKACVELYRQHEPVDIMTVTEKVRLMGKLDAVGGAFYITELSTKVSSGAHVQSHCMIIYQKYLQRAIIESASTAIQSAYTDTDDVFDLLDGQLNYYTGVMSDIEGLKTLSTKQIAEKIYKDILDKKKPETIESGISWIDNDMYGLGKGHLIVVAARPAMGKTAFALQIALNVARQGKGVGFITLEMDAEEILRRCYANLAEIDSRDISLNNVHESQYERLTKAADTLSKFKLSISSTSNTVNQISGFANNLKLKGELDLLIVDYMQLMSGDGENRQQEISEISRGLKQLAMKLKIPIIALSQLNRQVEQRGDKIPQLSDLRESGSIEQDANALIFLYRPIEYGLGYDDLEPSKWMPEPKPEDMPRFVGGILAKHRNGKLGKYAMRFFGETQKITNLQSIGQSPTNEPVKDLPF